MTDSVCSDLVHEPLPGTAKNGSLFIALEHQLGWSHDILDGGVFGDELTARIKEWLAERDGSLQLIRRPGRIGQVPCDGVTMYVAHCPPEIPAPASPGEQRDETAEPGDETAATSAASDAVAGPRLEVRKVRDVEEMLSLDVRLGRPTEGAVDVDKPLLLVCTHGKRDQCCAVKGRPVAQALSTIHPDVVWETSHSKGHRFAPALVLLPWNYSYGRLSAKETNDMLDDAYSGVLHRGGCRGRGVWDPRGQVAELAARETAGEWGMDAVASVESSDVVDAVLADGAHGGGLLPEVVEGLRSVFVGDPAADAAAVVAFADGRRFGVALRRIVTEGVLSSCGDAPGPKKGWRAEATVEL
ncbi:sucrase ferredoxin [uncultured Corynebacterium sp.]|uniref:sucrase ferredoxin n=1 Tax=uncultured Corynebacterium sp. TaxID=159447 RepID=UPI0025D2619B|nr:sucrase ferredoxin [uncultured Corynebacterium sp.]